MVRQWALKKREFRKEDRFNVIVEGPKGRTEAAPSSVSGSVPLGGPRRVYLGGPFMNVWQKCYKSGPVFWGKEENYDKLVDECAIRRC